MLLWDGGRRCQDDFCKRERLGDVKMSQEPMNASPLDVSIEVKKAGYIPVNLIVSLNTFPSVPPLLSPFRISIVLVSTTFHGLSQKWWNHRVGPSFLM